MATLTVITGGAGGMGLAAARVVGRDQMTLISDVDPGRLDAAERQLGEEGIRCATAVCDITDPESVADLVERARTLGTVSSVLHTAGLSPSMASADLILRVNAVGTVLINDAFHRIAGPGMAVVNVASVAGHQLPPVLAPRRHYKRALDGHPDELADGLGRICNRLPAKRRPQLAYVLSKNFVLWYTRVSARRFGAKGARVVSVSPGSFDTPMGRLEEDAGAGAMTQLGALRRLGTPSEIAELLAFVASDKPGYLTGVDIVCDGGVMAAMTVWDAVKLGRAH